MTSRNALVVRGGWPGHSPVEATDRFLPFLEESGFRVTVSDSLDVYTDADLMAGTDLIVQCWTMGTITAEQVAGLRGAVQAGDGTGRLARRHRRLLPRQQRLPAPGGGQFACHPGGFVDHTVEVVPERAAHPIVAGLTSVALHTEQYWVLADGHNQVLATTTLPSRQGDPWAEPVVSPAVWTRQWGEGRIFVCTVGHQPQDLDVPAVRSVVERGLTWASR